MGDARSDWSIIRALSEVLGKPLPYDTTDEVRARLAQVAPHFAQVDTVQSPMWLNGEYFQVRAFLLCLEAGDVAADPQQVVAMGFMSTMPGRGSFANGRSDIAYSERREPSWLLKVRSCNQLLCCPSATV